MSNEYNFSSLNEHFDRATSDYSAIDGSAVKKEKLDRALKSYQEVCSIYAWLQTHYPETNEKQIAGQLVFQGRRLLYGTGNKSEKSVGILEKIYLAYQPIKSYALVAAAVAITSAVCAALLVSINPDFGWNFINEQTAAKLKSGHIWTDGIQGINSIASSQIATNNIKVTFAAFATGVSGGILTVIILVFNGAHLGGIFAAIHPYGMAGRLLEFILAHGFLELSIIGVAGGCGLFIGDGLLKPGAKTRGEALRERATPAITVVVFSALCLLPCGFVEGFVSPNPNIPMVAKCVIGIFIGFLYWQVLLKRPKTRQTKSLLEPSGHL